MIYQLVFTPKSDQDLTKIKIWYDGISINLTKELFFEISKELKII